MSLLLKAKKTIIHAWHTGTVKILSILLPPVTLLLLVVYDKETSQTIYFGLERFTEAVKSAIIYISKIFFNRGS